VSLATNLEGRGECVKKTAKKTRAKRPRAPKKEPFDWSLYVLSALAYYARAGMDIRALLNSVVESNLAEFSKLKEFQCAMRDCRAMELGIDGELPERIQQFRADMEVK
jgi:hypothetical protein